MRERIAGSRRHGPAGGGSGTRLRVTLPAGSDDERPGRAAIRIERARVTIRIVLAEDQRMMLGALAVLLELEHDLAVVGTAADGDEALRLVVSLAPDVLLTDIEMPGLTGLDVAAEIRRRGLSTRVVILTTFARSGYLRRALDAGAVGLPAQGRAVRQRWPTRSARSTPAGARSIPSWRRCLGRGRSTHRSRARGPAPGRRGARQRRDRRAPAPVGRDGAELPVRGDRQARRDEPHRRRAARS